MIINGKEISEKIKEEIAAEVKALKDKGISCGLAVILVGDDPASAVYVRNKKLACEKVGIYSEVYTLPADSAEADVLDLIETLNKRDDINGILCQLPLPRHIDEQKVINAIDKDKDVDAFNPYNVPSLYRYVLPSQPMTSCLSSEPFVHGRTQVGTPRLPYHVCQ